MFGHRMSAYIHELLFFFKLIFMISDYWWKRDDQAKTISADALLSWRQVISDHGKETTQHERVLDINCFPEESFQLRI